MNGLYNVGDWVQVVHSPYDSVKDGAVARVVKIERERNGTVFDMLTVAGLHCTHFWEFEVVPAVTGGTPPSLSE